jgi:hypothetical protein
MIDHDRLFKELLRTFFLEFIELFLPAVREYLGRTRLNSSTRKSTRTSPPVNATKSIWSSKPASRDRNSSFSSTWSRNLRGGANEGCSANGCSVTSRD